MINNEYFYLFIISYVDSPFCYFKLRKLISLYVFKKIAKTIHSHIVQIERASQARCEITPSLHHNLTFQISLYNSMQQHGQVWFNCIETVLVEFIYEFTFQVKIPNKSIRAWAILALKPRTAESCAPLCLAFSLFLEMNLNNCSQGEVKSYQNFQLQHKGFDKKF